MSLPPGFLDELRNRTSLSQVVARKVAWDARKSNPGKGDFWAPCPFHQEKSASFHVDDRKGYYYCFGCHAKGDAVSFVRETENVGFMEAIEILAREAGLPMPARDPAAAQRADRRTELQQVMDEAIRFYRLQLQTGAGAAARHYLTQKRRVDGPAWDRWNIGWAPENAQAVVAALAEKGIAPDLMVASGVVAKSDSGRLYDRFHGRIVFPIRDARGRAISLGGRSLDPNARAKYLNGPETELFDKGRSLFNHAPAREAAGKGKPLIVAEGYMDVIALCEAGFTGAVAPLGTAITEDQLRLLWRIHPEPVIALDGDAAGQRAALRVIDLALPLLEAGQGLRFAILPPGQDPDDVIGAGGAGAMQKVLDDAQPMVRLLWHRETDGKDFDSPERKAALRKSLRAAVARIKDPDIRRYYIEAFQDFEQEIFRARKTGSGRFEPRFEKGGRALPPGKGGAGRRGVPFGPVVRNETKATLLARSSAERVIEQMREQAILAICLSHPQVIAPFEGSLDRLEMIEDGHQSILHALLDGHGAEASETLHARVCETVGRATVEKLMSSAHIVVLPAIKQQDNDALAIETLAEQLAKLNSERSLRREIEEAEGDMEGLVDEGLTWRLMKAADARNRAIKLNLDEMNDGGEDRAALSAQLQQLIDSEVWVKRRTLPRKPAGGPPADPVIRPDDSLEPPEDDSEV